MKHSLIGSLVILASVQTAVSSAHADGIVRSEAVLQMNNSIFGAPEFDFSSLLQGKETFYLADLIVDGEMPVEISGVSVAVNYELQTPSKTVVLGAELPLKEKSLAVELSISRLKVDALIKKQVGDVQVNVRVQGQCEDIRIALKGQANFISAIRMVVDREGLPVIRMPWARADWAQNAWRVGAFNCSVGGTSFGSQVERGLLNFLAQTTTQERVSEQVQAAVNARLTSYQAQVRQWFLQPRSLGTGIKGLGLILKPRAVLAIKSESFQIGATLEFVFSTPNVTALSVVAGSVKPEFSSGSSFALMLPKELPAALSDMAYRTGFYQFRRPGQEIPAFKKLLKNRVSQFLVWPQLILYSRSAPFFFDVNTSLNPRLSALAENGIGGVSGKIGGAIDVLTWAPKTETPRSAEDFLKMTRFYAEVTSDFQLMLHPSVGGTYLKVSFSKLDIHLKAKWEAEYQRYLWYSRIGLDSLKDGLETSLASDGVQIFLPHLPMTSQLNLNLDRFSLQKEWLVINLKTAFTGKEQ
jgi:hypothetical protein